MNRLLERRCCGVHRSSRGDVCVENRVSILVKKCKVSRKTWAGMGGATRTANRCSDNEMRGYKSPITKQIMMYRTLTSMHLRPPFTQSTTPQQDCSHPTKQCVTSKTPSRTELIGYS